MKMTATNSKYARWTMWVRLGAGAAVVVGWALMAAPAGADATPTPTPSATATAPSATPTPQPDRVSPPYDVAAVGATASGRVGTVVRISVGLTNLGPSDLPGPSIMSGELQGFNVELPSGTEIVGSPEGCAVVPADFGSVVTGCYVSRTLLFLPPGQSLILVYNLKIVSATTGIGTVRLTHDPDVPYDRDTNPANNTARIVVTVIVGATLPTTGTDVAPIVGAGLGSIVVGGLLLLLVRRSRRPQTGE